MQDATRGLEFLMVNFLGLPFYSMPRFTEACCKYMTARARQQLEVKGEKQVLGHLSLPRTHEDFP